MGTEGEEPGSLTSAARLFVLSSLSLFLPFFTFCLSVGAPKGGPKIAVSEGGSGHHGFTDFSPRQVDVRVVPIEDTPARG